MMLVQMFLLFLWNQRVSGTWRHCSDLLPLDLLSFVLERDTSTLPSGVRLRTVAGVRGVQLLSPDKSMSIPASDLLVNCDLFPQAFTIVVTLKVNRFANKRDEFIFSLLEPKKQTEISGEESGNMKDKTISEQKSNVGNKAKSDHLLLGLKVSPNGLQFLFKADKGPVEHVVFPGISLDQNQWHSLVLVVGRLHMKLTVDCDATSEIFVSKPFPSDLFLQASRFHIGSRGRWKDLFSGLLRQLVLVPNSDGSLGMCPSSDPQLAALSVPPLLSDLPAVRRRKNGHHSGTQARSSMTLERSCSESLQGELRFNPLRRTLLLCDGSEWITVLEDSQRLDYVLENQVLNTGSETHDVELFQIPSVGQMAALAQRSSASGSAVYLWTPSGFQLYQNISTYGALAWKHFRIGKKEYLVVSNSGEGEKNISDSSVIYKWSKRKKQFVTFQTLKTFCARDWEAFSINQHTYLAVANHRQGDSNHNIPSVIYKWDRSTKSFKVHQTLLTSGAYDWEFFTVGSFHFLVVANAFDGETTSVDSVIYVWVDGTFQVFQMIKTFCATDWEMFQIGSRVFLVVANGHRLDRNGPSQYTINSTIYELDMNQKMFVRFQDIITFSAVDWEFFSLGEQHFLVVANSYNGESYSLNSIIYRWQGYEGFVPIHWLPTIGCSDWEFFNSNGESYLIYSSGKAPLSKVFKLRTY